MKGTVGKLQKRVAAIHDISCFGKCSLTVALPIISAAGIETSVIPTAVLSTHTGDFSGYTFRDLTDDILPIAEHWNKCGIKFDSVYTGYLGSSRQIDIVLKSIELIKKPDCLIAVDPVMADDGKLYGGFSLDFPKHMLKLCRSADIITPNITEAAMMLGCPYRNPVHTPSYIEGMLSGLYELTGSKVVITGVSFDPEHIGAACFDGKKTELAFSKRVDALYHGTGDVFASALVSYLVNGYDLSSAMSSAVDFTCEVIMQTNIKFPDMHYSVAFEEVLPKFAENIRKGRSGRA